MDKAMQKRRLDWLAAKTHEAIERKYQDAMKRADAEDEKIIEENRLLRIMAEHKSLRPYAYADLMRERYLENWTGDDVIDVFRRMNISHQEKRAELFAWARELAKAYDKALATGAKADIEAYSAVKGKRVLKVGSDRMHGAQQRIGLAVILAQHPELYPEADEAKLETFGNIYAKYVLYDMSDALVASDDPKNFSTDHDAKPVPKGEGGEVIRLQQEIAMLKSSLAQSEMLMHDLQEEFDDRLETSREQELVDFFSKLNSERYGCILDEILALRRGIKQLRKNHCEIPIEVSGLFIFVDKIAQFVRDAHINPMLPPGKIREVRAQDIETCDYKGSPFASDDDVHRVQVLSPGWIYEDKKLQISRPKVKEVGIDE